MTKNLETLAEEFYNEVKGDVTEDNEGSIALVIVNNGEDAAVHYTGSTLSLIMALIHSEELAETFYQAGKLALEYIYSEAE